MEEFCWAPEVPSTTGGFQDVQGQLWRLRLAISRLFRQVLFWSLFFVSGDALGSLLASFSGAVKGGLHYIGSNMRLLQGLFLEPCRRAFVLGKRATVSKNCLVEQLSWAPEVCSTTCGF